MTNQAFNKVNNGFLLTRQVKDKGNALQITLWLKSEQGPVKLLIDNEFAVFFVESQQHDFASTLLRQQNIPLVKIKPLTLKTFKQQSVVAYYFSTLRSFYRARELLKENMVNGQVIKCYEDDIRPDDRFLMERFITADIDYIANQAVKNDYSLATKAQCKAASKNRTTQLTMLSLDIECSLAGELYSIGLYSKNDGEKELKRVLMIGQAPSSSNRAELIDDYIIWLADEKLLLVELLKQIQKIDADIFIGWNIVNFDFTLLQQRFDLYKLAFSIGRDGSKAHWRNNSNNSEQRFIEIAGRVVLDGIDLLKTATYSFPSFSLDNVANTLLGIGKKVHDVDNRIQEITDNFNHNKPALAAYNLEDCRLVWLIFEKTQLLAFAQLRAQLTGLAIDRIGGSVAAFTNLYLPKLHRSGYVAPNMGDGASDLVSPGGYVMNSIPGLYDNVLVLDFKSLYPSIIRTFKIDPMGLIEGLKVSDKTKEVKGFDGAYFSRDKHFLPRIIETLWSARDEAKLQKNAALSQAIKIIMNSFYGILGSTGCRFFDPRLAGSITKRSHEILKTTSVWIEAKGYQVIYGDTDSIFVHVGASKSRTESKNLGNELQSFINKKWRKTLIDDYQLDCHLEIEFETLFSRFFMPTIRGLKSVKNIGTKKRYAGVSNGELVFKGLETVRSDWTELSKNFQQELYRRIFSNEPVGDYIKEIVNGLKQGVHDDKLVYTKKIRRKLCDYVNTPPHIKAAILANHELKNRGMKQKYQHRSTIRYVITLDGVQPLEFKRSKLDYDYYIEKQLSQ